MMQEKILREMYESKCLSVHSIAQKLGCSAHKINYWLAHYGVKKRSISEALYTKWNPNGDPFRIHKPETVRAGIIFGLGIGLYWGEGTKASKTSVRLGNSDPALIRMFVTFLTESYQIDLKRLKFGLQIFGDMDRSKAINFWMKELKVSRLQFQKKITVTPHRGIGNYRHKSKYGVVTLYFNNRKLRDILCTAINGIQMV